MTPRVTIVIPCRNEAATIGKCLTAALTSDYPAFEVVVVDDASTDGSADLIRRFPCRLVRLTRCGGAAAARNRGVLAARGDILFFTDADCIVEPNAVSLAVRAIEARGPGTIVGGTYTRKPYDDGFFGAFQSVFIHYSETKHRNRPDYVATHAMAVDAEAFRRGGGFDEALLSMVEDVEFCHRMRQAGLRLVVDPALQVRHVFNFSLFRSLRNAILKSMHWTAYSIRNRDLFQDSGTASVELKVNVAAYFAGLALIAAGLLSADQRMLAALPPLLAANLFASRGLLRAFAESGGIGFTIAAALYYLLLYPLAVGGGAMAGGLKALLGARAAAAAVAARDGR